MRVALFIFFLTLLLPFAVAQAACSGPVGTEGKILYNQDFSVPQYCDGTNWIALVRSTILSNCVGPADCTAIGDQCADLTIFAGCHPTQYWKLFLHPNNQSAATDWSTELIDTGLDNDYDGRVNQDWVVANKTIADYPAFKLCDDFNTGFNPDNKGHTDWYLPSRFELYYFWLEQTAINAGLGDAFIATNYWTSTEYTPDTTGAWAQKFNAAGDFFKIDKDDSTRDVRCARRN